MYAVGDIKPWVKSGRVAAFLVAAVLSPLLIAYFLPTLNDWVTRKPIVLWVLIVATFALVVFMGIAGIRKTNVRAVNEFALLKPALNVTPEDLGFKPMKPGGREPKLGSRPFFEQYIPRVAQPYRATQGEQPVEFSENQLVALLARGEDLLLVGPPMQGKTRTAYHLMKALSEFVIVRLKPDHDLSPEACRQLSKKKVLCFLDDLHNQRNPDLIVANLVKLEKDYAEQLTILATARDGPELSSIFNAKRESKVLYDMVASRFVMSPLTDEQKSQLASDVNADPNRRYGSPGEICMNRAIGVILDRFERELATSARDAFRAAQLLTHWGVRDLTRPRLRLASEFVRHSDTGPVNAVELGEGLVQLEESAFLLSSASAEFVLFEEAYTVGPYADRFFGRPITDSLDCTRVLINRSLALGDTELANSVALGLMSADYLDSAALAFGEIAARTSDPLLHSRAILGQGLVRSRLNQNHAAIQAYEALITTYGDSLHRSLQDSVAQAFIGKGAILTQNNQPREAAKIYDELIEKYAGSKLPSVQKSVAWAFIAKGVIQGQNNQAGDEVETYESMVAQLGDSTSPQVQEMLARVLFNMGIKHEQQNERDLQLRAYEQLIERYGCSTHVPVQEVVARGFINKGIAYAENLRPAAALQAYESLILNLGNSRHPIVQEWVAVAFFNKGIVLGQNGRPDATIQTWKVMTFKYGDMIFPSPSELEASTRGLKAAFKR